MEYWYSLTVAVPPSAVAPPHRIHNLLSSPEVYGGFPQTPSLLPSPPPPGPAPKNTEIEYQVLHVWSNCALCVTNIFFKCDEKRLLCACEAVSMESLLYRLSDALYLHVRFQPFIQLANLFFQLLQIVGLVQDVWTQLKRHTHNQWNKDTKQVLMSESHQTHDFTVSFWRSQRRGKSTADHWCHMWSLCAIRCGHRCNSFVTCSQDSSRLRFMLANRLFSSSTSLISFLRSIYSTNHNKRTQFHDQHTE